MGFSKILIALLFICLAYPYVVVNSQEATDASSAVFYANAINDSVYVVVPGSDPVTTTYQIGRQGNILLIESAQTQIVAGLANSIATNGNNVDPIGSTGTELNLELARRSGVKKFIISDPVYGYNVVSTIPYAKASGAYMLFANKSNAQQIASFLSGARPQSVLLYGEVDTEVSDALSAAGVAPQSINTGDQYSDNMEIMNRYYQIVPDKKDILLTDGSFLEASISEGKAPILLISDLVPDTVHSFILEKVRSGQIKTGTLIGSEHISPAYNLMKSIELEMGEKNFSVFVKFGQASTQGGTPGALSTYPLPYPYAQVSLVSASYDPSRQAFELAYRNTGNANAYVKSSIAVLLNGAQVGAVGDNESYRVKRGETKGVRYAFANPGEGQLSINDTTYYGTSKLNFDKGFLKYMDVGRISFVDQSSMAIPEATYSSFEDKLTLKVRNNGSVDTFYRLTVSYVNDEGVTVYEEEQVRNLSSGRNEIITLSGVVKLPQGKEEQTKMNVTAAYGAREAFLEKTAAADVKIESFPWWILLILLLILLLIAYWYYRKRKKEKEAQAQEPAAAKKKK